MKNLFRDLDRYDMRYAVRSTVWVMKYGKLNDIYWFTNHTYMYTDLSDNWLFRRVRRCCWVIQLVMNVIRALLSTWANKNRASDSCLSFDHHHNDFGNIFATIYLKIFQIAYYTRQPMCKCTISKHCLLNNISSLKTNTDLKFFFHSTLEWKLTKNQLKST